MKGQNWNLEKSNTRKEADYIKKDVDEGLLQNSETSILS